MIRALLGLLLVLGAAAAHFLLIFAGVYRKYPVEWWAVALGGAVLAATAFKAPGVGGRVIAVITILLVVAFALSTTVVTRIRRPGLTVVAGQTLAPFTVVSDTGVPLSFPRACGTQRATLLVFFRGVW